MNAKHLAAVVSELAESTWLRPVRGVLPRPTPRLGRPVLIAGCFAILLLGLGATPPAGRPAPARPAPSGSTAKSEARASVLANQPLAPITPPEIRRQETPPVLTPTPTSTSVSTSPATTTTPPPTPSGAAPTASPAGEILAPPDRAQLLAAVRMLGLTLVYFLPAAVLMFTSFVRINIVLVLLRQALGSPQVPGNQVLSALALLLTVLVMRPVAEVVYNEGIEPYATGRISAAAAWEAGTKPIKMFMIRQIERTNHEEYFWQLYDLTTPESAHQPTPVEREDFPLQVVAPAFLLSELTTALVIGFYLYLPFLVIDLVVSSVLAAMGLFMLPPSLIALPLKLILFVLADGWLLVATMLLQSFAN